MEPEDENAMLRAENRELQRIIRKFLAEKGIDVKVYFATNDLDKDVARILAEAP